MKNIIQSKFTAAERETFGDLMDQVEAFVADKLASLTEEERSRYGSVNEQNKLFVNKLRDYRQSQPNLSSPDIDWDEFENDYQARHFFEAMAMRFLSLAYRFQSTKILHDYDNYQDGLREYKYAQYKREAGEPGYAEKVAELKQFFARTGKDKAPEGEKTEEAPENNN